MVHDDEEPDLHGSRTAVWGNYLAWHARKQLAFGGYIPKDARTMVEALHMSSIAGICTRHRAISEDL